jgi:hypothetical protein
MDSMDADSNPELGFMQPEHGFSPVVRSGPMGRPRKEVEPKGPLEAKIGAQLSIWMARSLRKYPTEKQQITALAKRSSVGKETVRKILRGTQSAQIDSLHAITEALGWSLLDLFAAIDGGETAKEGREAPGTVSEDESLPGTLQRR